MLCKLSSSKNYAKFSGKYLCYEFVFNDVSGIEVFSCEFYEVCNNTYFAEYLRTATFQLITYLAHILLSEARLKEEEEYIKII